MLGSKWPFGYWCAGGGCQAGCGLVGSGGVDLYLWVVTSQKWNRHRYVGRGGIYLLRIDDGWLGDDFKALGVSFSCCGASSSGHVCSLDGSSLVWVWVISWVGLGLFLQEENTVSDFDVVWFDVGLSVLVDFLLGFGSKGFLRYRWV